MRLTGVLAVCATAVLAPVVGHSTPSVTIRTRADVAIHSVRRARQHIEITGRVVGVLGLDPLSGALVKLEFGGRPGGTARADADGWFLFKVPAARAKGRVQVTVPGTRLYDEASWTLDRLEIEKAPVDVFLTAELIEGRLHYRALAGTAEGGAAGTIEIAVRSHHKDTFQVLGTTPMVRGEATGEISMPGIPGPARVRAIYLGSDEFARSTGFASVTVTVTATTLLTLRLRPNPTKGNDGTVARGLLRVSSGSPLAGQVVAIQGSGGSLGQAVTGVDGGFTVSISVTAASPKSQQVQAEFRSPVNWLKDARSSVVTLRYEATRPIPIRYTLGALAVVGLALAAFAAMRSRSRLAPDVPAPEGGEAVSRPVMGGVRHRHRRRSRVSALTGRDNFSVSGRCVGAARGRPVAEALVEASCGQESRHAEGTAAGLFALDGLGRGKWTLRVTADHHVPETFEVAVPHRGEWLEISIRLVPLRERIFDVYCEASAQYLPSPAKMGVWTPRQILAHLSENAPAHLAALTAAVELAYFGERLPVGADLDGIRELVAAVRAEQFATPEAAHSPRADV